MWGSDFKFLFLAPALLAFLFSLYAGGETLTPPTSIVASGTQDIFPIEKEKLCPKEAPNCQAKSCMDSCLADGEDEGDCLEECVQYAHHFSKRNLFCSK